ncbi:MAG: hypothetical protein ACKVK3_13030 [Acidimicrobiales bacterium]|jgi:hypothetical protein
MEQIIALVRSSLSWFAANAPVILVASGVGTIIVECVLRIISTWNLKNQTLGSVIWRGPTTITIGIWYDETGALWIPKADRLVQLPFSPCFVLARAYEVVAARNSKGICPCPAMICCYQPAARTSPKLLGRVAGIIVLPATAQHAFHAAIERYLDDQDRPTTQRTERRVMAPSCGKSPKEGDRQSS